MAEPTNSSAEQIQADLATCERALDELLRAIVRHDDERAATAVDAPATAGLSIGSLDLDRRRLQRLTNDPVRKALREGVRRIGEELYRLGGGTSAMRASLDKVAELDQNSEDRRIAIMDAAFDGIGTDTDRWWV